MTEIDTKRLRAVAEKATPGEWGVWFEHALDEDGLRRAVLEQVELTPEQDRCGGIYMIDASGKCPAITGCGPTSESNAFFLAAASPVVVIAMCGEIDLLRYRLKQAEARIAQASKHTTVYKAVERVLDEHSAWISRPNHEVTAAIALAAVIAADLESGASNTLGSLHERCDEASAENAKLRALLKRAGEALSFYADTSKYPAPLTGGMGDLWSDCGRVANGMIHEIKEAIGHDRP